MTDIEVRCYYCKGDWRNVEKIRLDPPEVAEPVVAELWRAEMWLRCGHRQTLDLKTDPFSPTTFLIEWLKGEPESKRLLVERLPKASEKKRIKVETLLKETEA